MTTFFMGVDLGQSADYTAVAILQAKEAALSERRPYTGDEKNGRHYELRHLERLRLGTTYPAVVARVATLVNQPLLERDTSIAIDQTGVGAPVVDLLRLAKLPARLFPITITGGDRVIRERDAYHVPKRDLISSLQVMLHTGRLKVAQSLPEAQTLVRELVTYQVQITNAGNDVYGQWREGQHDDLVLAVALALWLAEQHKPSESIVAGYFRMG